jgi:hypothetical protein
MLYIFVKYFANEIETTHKKLVIILSLIYPKQNTLLGSSNGNEGKEMQGNN